MPRLIHDEVQLRASANSTNDFESFILCEPTGLTFKSASSVLVTRMGFVGRSYHLAHATQSSGDENDLPSLGAVDFVERSSSDNSSHAQGSEKDF
jgi:hypothetical protein